MIFQRRRLSSPWFHALLISGTAFLVLFQYGPGQQPLLHDPIRALYMGQVVYRGDSLYGTTICIYPPLGPLISAGTMLIGQWLDLPSYLAPRYAALPMAALSAGLLTLIVRRMTARAWVGTLAGLILAGFSYLGVSATLSLGLQLLVLFFTLLMIFSIQRRWWAGMGCFTGMAISCWQPAIALFSCFCVTIWASRGRSRNAFWRYAAGFLLGITPALLYLTLTGGWSNFLESNQFMLFVHGSHLGQHPLQWMKVMLVGYGPERWIGILAILGFFWSIGRTARLGIRKALSIWLHPRSGGMVPLTLGWIGFNTIEFQNRPDLLPFLPLLAFWAAWTFRGFYVTLIAHLRRKGLRHQIQRVGQRFALLMLVGTSAYMFNDAFRYVNHYTLAEQQALVQGILSRKSPNEPIVALGAEVIYILSEQPAPWRYLQLNQLRPKGCTTLIKRLKEIAPPIVVIRGKNPCLQEMRKGVLAAYHKELVATHPLQTSGQWELYQLPEQDGEFSIVR